MPTVPTFLTIADLKVGDRVRTKNSSEVGSRFRNLTGTVSSVEKFYVWIDFDTTAENDNGGVWRPEYLEKVEQPTNPVASLQHETSKNYAARADSIALSPTTRKILQAAAAGEEVDVVEFRKALIYVLSIAATRTGHSSDRKTYARQARHLIHWCDAIIDNHLKGLPVYEGGPRSPKIHQLEQEKRRLMAQVEDRERAYGDVRRELERAHRSEKIEVDRSAALIREKTALEVQVEDLLKGRTNDLAAMQHLYSECNEFHAALEYAFSLLDEEGQTRLAGFRDGYATRVNDEA